MRCPKCKYIAGERDILIMIIEERWKGALLLFLIWLAALG
jgi:hypothetical protein